jgi:CheY-like chemotaxis protein
MRDTIYIRLGMDTAQSKHRLLLVDGDPKSLRVLDVSLKKAGFEVTTATSGREAIALLEASVPDLIISDTDLHDMDGFELCSQIKGRPEWSKIPFLFVSGRKSIEDKIRGLELGVDDYLTKPIYIKEIGIRVRTALQRAERERMESRRDGRTRFAGDLSDVGVVDLVQTIELNRKSGIIHIVNRDTRRGSIFFRDGKVIDGEVGRLSGANAIYRLFSWSEGQFAVEFKQIRRHDVIDTPMAPLLMEGMRRLDESTRLLEKLPSTSSVLEVDCRALAEELAELPDEVNTVLRLCDGTRTLQEVVEDSEHPDLEALTFIDKLFTTQIIFAREAPDHGGESEPSERLAHWLSEGGAEDGAAAQDASASSEFAATQILAPEAEELPANKPAPARVPERNTTDADPSSATLPAASTDAPLPAPAEPPSIALDLFSKTPDPLPDLPRTIPAAPQLESPAAVTEAMLSAEESLGAVLPPKADTSYGGSNEFAPPSDTLKGLPVETLFAEPEAKVDLPQPVPPSLDSNTVIAPMEARSTKPLGLAERLLSEDSAVRASAMHEAIDDDGGKVERSQSNEHNTREYGNPAAEAAAALVQEVVSAAHETKHESSPAWQPERPTKEVDWGAWPTGLAKAQTSSPKSDVAVMEPTSPSLEQSPIEVVLVNKPEESSSPPGALPSAEGKAEDSQPQESRVASQPSSDSASVPPPANSKAPEIEEKRAAHPPSRPRPRPDTPVGRSARKTSPARQIWIMASGAFALGVIGYLAFVKNTVPLPEPPPPPPAVGSPLEHLRSPQAEPAPAPTRAVAETTPPVVPSAGTESKAERARLWLGTPPSAAAEVRRKCLETDATRTGKAKAVFAACKPALEADPKDVEVMVILARADIDRGRLVEARALAKKALATDPQRLDAYVFLGTAEQEAGRVDEARSAYKKYLELAPDGPFARELRAILNNL